MNSTKISLIVVISVLVLGYSLTMMPTVQAQTSSTVACVVYKQNGAQVGTKHCSPIQANDVHLQFSGHCAVQFSKDGVLTGTPVLCPQGVNDFTLRWDTTGVVTHFTWSTDGTSVGTVTVPSGANGFNFAAQSVTAFQWSLNGGLLGHPVLAPQGTNGFVGGIQVLTSPSIPEFPFSFSLVIMFVAVAAVYLGIRQKMPSGFKGY